MKEEIEALKQQLNELYENHYCVTNLLVLLVNHINEMKQNGVDIDLPEKLKDLLDK